MYVTSQYSARCGLRKQNHYWQRVTGVMKHHKSRQMRRPPEPEPYIYLGFPEVPMRPYRACICRTFPHNYADWALQRRSIHTKHIALQLHHKQLIYAPALASRVPVGVDCPPGLTETGPHAKTRGSPGMYPQGTLVPCVTTSLSSGYSGRATPRTPGLSPDIAISGPSQRA